MEAEISTGWRERRHMVSSHTMLVPFCHSFLFLSIASLPFSFGEGGEGLKGGGIYSFIFHKYLLSAYSVAGAGTTAEKVMIPYAAERAPALRSDLVLNLGSATYKLWFLGQVIPSIRGSVWATPKWEISHRVP